VVKYFPGSKPPWVPYKLRDENVECVCGTTERSGKDSSYDPAYDLLSVKTFRDNHIMISAMNLLTQLGPESRQLATP
jgi:hypothetical protein